MLGLQFIWRKSASRASECVVVNRVEDLTSCGQSYWVSTLYAYMLHNHVGTAIYMTQNCIHLCYCKWGWGSDLVRTISGRRACQRLTIKYVVDWTMKTSTDSHQRDASEPVHLNIWKPVESLGTWYVTDQEASEVLWACERCGRTSGDRLTARSWKKLDLPTAATCWDMVNELSRVSFEIHDSGRN